MSLPKKRPICCNREMYPCGGVIGSTKDTSEAHWRCEVCKQETHDLVHGPIKPICTAARKLTAAVAEYKRIAKLEGTKPMIVFLWGPGFMVTAYHSKAFLDRHGWYVCNTEIKDPNLRIVNR